MLPNYYLLASRGGLHGYQSYKEGELSIQTETPLNENNPHYVRIENTTKYLLEIKKPYLRLLFHFPQDLEQVLPFLHLLYTGCVRFN